MKKFGESTTIHFDIALEEGRGDLSTSAAMQLAKRLRKQPRDVAEVIAGSVRGVKGVKKAEVVGAGYVNVDLAPEVLAAGLSSTEFACEPQKTRSKEAPVIVDYSGPNIAKPLGIHHILSTIIGQALVNLYRHDGTRVLGWSYPGDWGTQFGKLSVAFNRWGSGKLAGEYSVDELLKLYVRFHAEAEKDPSLDDEARAAFARLEAGDKELRSFWSETVRVSKEALAKMYERLHVRLDIETGESFYEDKMEPILKEGEKKKVFKIGEKGALIVEFSEESGLPPFMLRKSDGSTLYATRDLAMVRYRLDTYHPRALYYVVDVAQSLHFKQLEATCQLLKWEMPEFEHVVFGRMRFADGSMSTRKGTVLKLEDVLDESIRRAQEIIKERGDAIQTDDPSALADMMGVGALVYGILSQNRRMDIQFDWDKMLSFEGNSAPYLQYTHARARSVLRKAGKDVSALSSAVTELSPKERLLTKLLLKFPDTLTDARESRLPHKLCNYLYEVCQSFNSFYNSDPILQARDDVRDFRLGLTSLTALVLKTGAELLTLRVPERM